MKMLVEYLDKPCLLSASWHHNQVFPLLQEMWQKLRTRLSAQNFEQLIVCLSTTVIGESILKQWQSVFLEQSPGASFWIQVVAMQILASYITIFEVKLQSSFMSSIMSWRYWALSIFSFHYRPLSDARFWQLLWTGCSLWILSRFPLLRGSLVISVLMGAFHGSYDSDWYFSLVEFFLWFFICRSLTSCVSHLEEMYYRCS
jgi:hypothetical protein